ncbi:MAG: MlaA family lipoprotein [Alphaproteobacteria bacterium]
MALALSAMTLTGCATAPDSSDPEDIAEYEEINDPAEPTNRTIFAINQGLDKVLLKPVARAYKEVAPDKVRLGIHNVLNNIRTPVIFFNDVLQGDFDHALITLIRFLINSTAGIFGIRDTAADLGIEFRNEDFGQTLAVWNIPEGPYVMLPIFGPSNPRDAVGRVVDFIIDPLNIWAGNTGNDWVPISETATDAVSFRARHYDTIEDLERSSLDFYAAVRSLYRQRRNDEINNGEIEPGTSVPSIGQFFDDEDEYSADEVSQAD